MVIEGMADLGHYRLALHYSEYRLRHEQLRKKSDTDAKVLSLLRHENELAKQENANKDPVLNSTMRDYLASEVSEDICRRYIFPEDVIHAHDEGMIHVHDMGYVSGPISNCELVNLEDMLQNGTVITDTMIEKPHSFSTACNIATQIIAQVASNTYGGQTISLSHLLPLWMRAGGGTRMRLETRVMQSVRNTQRRRSARSQSCESVRKWSAASRPSSTRSRRFLPPMVRHHSCPCFCIWMRFRRDK